MLQPATVAGEAPASTAAQWCGPRTTDVENRLNPRDGATAIRPWSVAVAVAVAGASGVLYALGFPPFSLWPLTWIALVPLLLAASTQSPRGAALCGLAWALAMTAGVAWCLPEMLTSYFALSGVAAWFGTLAVGVFLAGIYVAAYAAWIAWLVRRRIASPLLLASGWVVCEFARANLLIGNPWALSAYSQMRATTIMQVADATGPYGMGFLLAAVNACVAAALTPALRGRRPLRSIAIVVILLAGTFAYGEWRLGQTFVDGDAVEIAVVQAGLPASPAGDREQRRLRLQRYLELTERAAIDRPDLIVWPEYAVESYMQEASQARDNVLRAAHAAGADLILGGPHYVRRDGRTRYHNSIFLVHEGQLGQRYDKVRLVPFAEGDELSWLRPERPVSYEAGPEPTILGAAGLRLGAFLCFESMYPDVVRAFASRDATVLVNLSNDSWFGFAPPAAHQLDIAALRSVENRRYLVRAAATGFSAVVDPYGRIVTRSEFGSAEVLATRIAPAHTRTPYQRWGDAFAWLNAAVVLAASVMTSRKRLQ